MKKYPKRAKMSREERITWWVFGAAYAALLLGFILRTAGYWRGFY